MLNPGLGAAPIIVLDPDLGQGRQIAEWLRQAGLGTASASRTCDEAIFLLGKRPASLLVIDEYISRRMERRLLQHLARCGHHEAPAIVRLRGAMAPEPETDRDLGWEIVEKPLSAHEVVVHVAAAMQRPDLIGRLDRYRDESNTHLEAAQRMQHGLLPTLEQLQAVQLDCRVGIAALYRSGEAVGGDFWAIWPTGRGRFALAIVDFAGHGLSAALNTFRLHAVLSEHALPRGQPQRMTSLLNDRLHSLLPRGQYATMIYLQIDPAGGRVAWCGAGGPPPMFVSVDGCRDLMASGLPLGVRAGAAYRSHHTHLPEAGILCVFSDGLFESGADAPDVPRNEIARVLIGPARQAAAGRLAVAAQEAADQLTQLRQRYECPGHSDDIMAICVAIGGSQG